MRVCKDFNPCKRLPTKGPRLTTSQVDLLENKGKHCSSCQWKEFAYINSGFNSKLSRRELLSGWKMLPETSQKRCLWCKRPQGKVSGESIIKCHISGKGREKKWLYLENGKIWMSGQNIFIPYKKRLTLHLVALDFQSSDLSEWTICLQTVAYLINAGGNSWILGGILLFWLIFRKKKMNRMMQQWFVS